MRYIKTNKYAQRGFRKFHAILDVEISVPATGDDGRDISNASDIIQNLQTAIHNATEDGFVNEDDKGSVVDVSLRQALQSM
jgi:hypothetical protein